MVSSDLLSVRISTESFFFLFIYCYFVPIKLARTLAPEDGCPCYRMTDMYLQSICRAVTL